MPPDHLRRQAEPRSAWRTLARSFAPSGSRGQVITGLLCALLGFALVVQVQANRSEGLSSLRQDELGALRPQVGDLGLELLGAAGDLVEDAHELVLAQARQALAPVGLDLDNEGEAEQRAQQTGDDLASAAARCERARERAPGRSRFGLPSQVVGWHLRPSAGGAGWPRRSRRS